ncbi:MAG TPA: uroporphyrinogen-III C-methyltransferase [Burkholderiaceae bacterium]|nr:uroporphyrinogen-III C-methyltransferase [Burkholderiaceae bacterium]
MNDEFNAPVASVGAGAPAAADVPPRRALRALWGALLLLGVVSAAALVLAWKADQRGASLEPELVRRQQESAVQAGEARALAKQAQEGVSDASAKVALLEARLSEVAVQRSQLDDLIQSLSRSRDENLLVDVEASIRVALQQNAITGSAEPLVATLKQADERLARYNQPRLEGVRRAIGRDLERVKATGVADIGALGVKLDEAIRGVDELPLLGVADARPAPPVAPVAPAARPAPAAKPAKGGAVVPASAAPPAPPEASRFDFWNALGEKVWGELKSLVRVTRIDHPEAMLLAPEQTFFIRENLKLRLLNARLALLSRQFDTAQADLMAAQAALDRYFDRNAKRTVLASELVRQVLGQARQVVVPRPDDTLAALAAAAAGR